MFRLWIGCQPQLLYSFLFFNITYRRIWTHTHTPAKLLQFNIFFFTLYVIIPPRGQPPRYKANTLHTRPRTRAKIEMRHSRSFSIHPTQSLNAVIAPFLPCAHVWAHRTVCRKYGSTSGVPMATPSFMNTISGSLSRPGRASRKRTTSRLWDLRHRHVRPNRATVRAEYTMIPEPIKCNATSLANVR